ncbi:MAG: GNAT family N-acetyltransferase [Bacillota bacterium]
MTHGNNLRLVKIEDCIAILGIYAPFIKNTSVTFECEVPTASDFSNRIRNIAAIYPWLIYETEGGIVGYAYASKYSERAAYRWSVNLSVYIKDDYQGKGIGQALYRALFELLQATGYCNAYACITLPNVRSERFHESLGFKSAGVFHNAGYKLGKWHDVIWYEQAIGELSNPPTEPLKITDVATSEINNILEKHT